MNSCYLKYSANVLASAARILLVLFLNILFLSYSCPAIAQQNKIKVAIFVGRGAEASEFRKEFDRSDDDTIDYETVIGEDIRDGYLNKFDAILVPGGSARREAISMGIAARDEVRRFVKDGGIYMGVCAGAYLASEQSNLDLSLIPLTTLDAAHWYRVDDMTGVDVELTPAGMEIFGIPKRNVRIGYENGPIFGLPAPRPDMNFCPVGFFRSEVVGDGGQRGVMLGAPAMILGKYGRGVVLILSPHPEETPGLKEVELHALRWLYQKRSEGVSAVIAKSIQDALPPNQRAEALNQKSNTKGINTELGMERPESSVLGEQAFKLAESVFAHANVVSYSHHEVPASKQVVTFDDGSMEARTDCSGFMSYIVDAVGPRHYQVIQAREPQASYPQAKIWAHFFNTLDSTQAFHGWLGISNWRDLSPGDFIAWVEGKSSSSGNTGHVMMVAGKPGGVKEENGFSFFEVPVIDSSSVYHFAPERLPPNAHQEHRNGLGIGTVRIILSKSNEPIGYWAGTYWGEGDKPVKGPTLDTMVRFARMTSLVEAGH